jgi:hypothetical protein
MTVTPDADLRRALAGVVVAADGGDFVLGRPDLGVYVAVPEPGAAFVQTLQRGESLAAATAAASTAAGETVDGADFLAGLTDLTEAGLLDPVAQPTSGSAGNDTRGRQIRWVEGISPRVAGRLFGRPARVAYLLAVVFAVAVLVSRPDLRPSVENLWFLPDPVLSLLAFTVSSLVFGALHEAWHWLAGRAAGVPAVFRVSYRGLFLVFETDLSQLATTPRGKRYMPMLAGMACDALVLALALGVRLLHHAGLVGVPPLLDRYLGALAVGQVLALVWQAAAVYLRSDMYAVLANALRCHNLYRTTWLTLKGRLWRLPPAEAAELADASPHDRAVARWFGLFYLAGILALMWTFVTFALPFLISMLVWLVTNLSSLAPTSPAFWESAALLVYLVAAYAGAPLLAARERRLRRTGRLL